MSIINTLSQLTRLFLANPCPLCERPTAEVLCRACHDQILGCHPMGTAYLPHVSQPDNNTLTVFTWRQYQGVLKQALALLKYGNQAELGIWLGLQLGNYWRTRHTNPPFQQATVIPIPLHYRRQQQRGYNQAALIAKGFCRATGLSYADHSLIRTKETHAMHSLGIRERQDNLNGAFQLGPKLPPTSKPILLIDDIYTTGSTALTATSVLRKAGYTVPAIMTVARAVFKVPTKNPSKSVQFDQAPNWNPNT